MGFIEFSRPLFMENGGVVKMSKIKIAFFDIDGTLIDMNKKKISEKIIYTLKELKANGIIICIATGRAPMTIPKFDGIEFDAYLAFMDRIVSMRKKKYTAILFIVKM